MTRFEIVGGPSKLSLMFVLFRETGTSQSFFFKLLDPQCEEGVWAGDFKIEVTVDGLLREDGSGEKWLFEGYALLTKVLRIPGIPDSAKVKGYFNTQTRKGWIEVTN